MTDSLDHGYLPDGTRVPILFGVSSDSGQTIRVWCRFCGKYHTHGRNPNEPGSAEAHRWAHCAIDDSPYSATGYIIIEVGSVARRRYGEGYIVIVEAPQMERVGRSKRAKLAMSRTTIDDVTLARIHELRAAGWSLREIARELSLSHEAVRQVLMAATPSVEA